MNEHVSYTQQGINSSFLTIEKHNCHHWQAEICKQHWAEDAVVYTATGTSPVTGWSEPALSSNNECHCACHWKKLADKPKVKRPPTYDELQDQLAAKFLAKATKAAKAKKAKKKKDIFELMLEHAPTPPGGRLSKTAKKNLIAGLKDVKAGRVTRLKAKKARKRANVSSVR